MSIEKMNQFKLTEEVDKNQTDNAEQAWPMSDQDESEFLKDLAIKEIDLICNQLESFVAVDPQIAARGYKYLLEKYADHPQTQAWEDRMNELLKSK